MRVYNQYKTIKCKTCGKDIQRMNDHKKARCMDCKLKKQREYQKLYKTKTNKSSIII